MSFKGMDTAALLAFSGRLDRTAERLRGAHGGLGTQLHGVAWHGSLAERFRADWSGPYARQVAGACQQLTDLAAQLRQEAARQEGASGVGGTGGFGGLGGLAGRHGRPGSQFPGSWHRPVLLGPPIFPMGSFAVPAGLGLALAGSRLMTREVADPHFRRAVELMQKQAGQLPTMDQRLTTLLRTGAISKDAAWEARASASATVSGDTTIAGIPAQGSATASSYAEAHASGHASIGVHGADLSGVAGASVGATAAVVGSIGGRNLGVSGGASVSAQASAKASGGVHVDGRGASAKAGAEIGASVSADAHVTAHTGGIDTTAGVHAYAGVQAHAKAEATVTAQDVKATVSIGAALGVGAGCDVTVEVHPQQVWQNVQHLAAPHTSGVGQVPHFTLPRYLLR